MSHTYVVATVRPWNIRVFREIVAGYPGKWYLVTDPEQLTADAISSLAPRYVFFPHWNALVGEDILGLSECVCFHETDLPFGRGGSPLQNLIARGIHDTKLSALRMTDELDAGPIYMQRPLSLHGLAEEIYLRAAHLVAEMIREIALDEPRPTPQVGTPVSFRRRRPAESEIPADRFTTLEEIFDHIRMLDAAEYPPAFIRWGAWRLEFSRPALRTDFVEASVRISMPRDRDA
ncbi:MAG: methionyl-tRNA formyltransferase [Solirubrobacterales bacterium]